MKRSRNYIRGGRSRGGREEERKVGKGGGGG